MKVLFQKMSLKGFVLLACMLTGGAVGAQENKAEKPKWDVWVDLHFGSSFLDGSKGFTDYMQSNLSALDYRSTYLGALQGGIHLPRHLAGRRRLRHLVHHEELYCAVDAQLHGRRQR